MDRGAHDRVAAHASCPVINGLSDYYHPCQALADLFTVQEVFGVLKGKTLVFVGDGNNMARSLPVCCGLLGVRFVLAAPEGYGFDEPFLETYRGQLPSEYLSQNGTPDHAIQEADVVYTDVWTSMGQEAEAAERHRIFAPYQVNARLMGSAAPDALFMHCLPAHRGDEVTDDVIDSAASVVFDQAENRLHTQKALLAMMA